MWQRIWHRSDTPVRAMIVEPAVPAAPAHGSAHEPAQARP
jgi:hypothetical protein